MKFNLAFPITELSGKAGTVGAVVATGWRGLNIFRKYVQPYNPVTNEQSAIRNIFSACSKAFSGMSEAQLSEWNDYAARFPIKEYGKDIILPANSIFNRINSYRMINGQPISLNAPNSICDFSITDVTACYYTPGNDTLAVTLTHSGSITTNRNLFFKISPPQSNAIVKIPSGSYRCVKGVNTNSIVPLAASGQSYVFNSPVFTPAHGEFIGIQIIPLSSTYSPGTEFRTVAIVDTTP